MKYILVSGGVVSGLGNSLTASSIALLLKSSGLRITLIKIDPYLNVDASTLSPFEHGEVYVLDDGGEVSPDLGNYERFLDIKLTRDNNITTGKIYQHVIEKERRGDYLGKTVQIIPHVTDAVQEWIERIATVPVDGIDGPPDVCVIELGGTIGDIESRMYIEAFGQLCCSVGTGNFCIVHVSLVPVINVVGEQKTKPTQHSIHKLRSLGLKPDILVCRSTEVLEATVKSKLSQFCCIPEENIASLHEVSNIWQIPLILRDQKTHEAILKVLNLHSYSKELSMKKWKSRAEICDKLNDPVRISVVGQYTGFSDAYHSVVKALLHASVARRKKLVIDWIAAEDLEDSTRVEDPENFNTAWNLLKGADGILVPGGFEYRGIEGMIFAAKYARKNRVPYLGICLGMQIAVLEFARSVVGVKDANSTEFDPKTTSPYVIFMPEGGSMRLGSRRTYFHFSGCKSAKMYGNTSFVDERQRHTYEVNPEVVKQLEDAGMASVGKDETGQRMEIMELASYPFFIGTQFHPEFNSRPGKPSPIFQGFISAASIKLDSSHTMTRKLVMQRSIKIADSPHRKAARLLQSARMTLLWFCVARVMESTLEHPDRSTV